MSYALKKQAVEKVWGRTALPSEFCGDTTMAIGEVWFTPGETSQELLVKYLFTSEKLSVQVHPSDQEARRMGLGPRGKEECWLVLKAEPGASVALGLDKEYDTETVRSAAEDGSIEDMLVWHEAREGDFFHVPPGTIHAIGAGLTLLEVQQNSDVTFRFYDYGRPRELHLEQAIECAHLKPYGATKKRAGKERDEVLLDGPRFSVRSLSGEHVYEAEKAGLVIPLSGYVEVETEPLPEASCVVLEQGDKLRSWPGAHFLVVQCNV